MEAPDLTYVQRECHFCGITFFAQRSDAVYCSGRCRQAAYRWRTNLPRLFHQAEFKIDGITKYLAFADSRPLAQRYLDGLREKIRSGLAAANIKRTGGPYA